MSDELVFAYDSNPGETIYGWSNSDAGSTCTGVSVHDPAYDVTTERLGFKLLRTPRKAFNAGPEPVRKGAAVTVSGTLQRADWDLGEYRGYGSGGQEAKVQFKKKGSSTWTTVKTVSVGEVSTKVPVEATTARDGSYRLHFAGNSVSSASVTPADHVDVN